MVTIVAGIIGSGKSTLAVDIARVLGPETLIFSEPDEAGDKNPYLSDFYADKARWAFSMQIHMLSSRHRHHQAAQWYAMGTGNHAVLDSSYFSDVCFARLMARTGEITPREFETYRLLYQSMTASVLLPSVCVHLQVDPEVAAERIRRRASEREGRRSELVIDLDYLQGLDEEITHTIDILREQGVRIMDVPWNDDLGSPADRAGAVHYIARRILETTPANQFDTHHRRVLV